MSSQNGIEMAPEELNWRESTVKVNDGYKVWRWPEFQALLKRMGVPMALDCKAITLRIAVGEQPHITHEYSPRQIKVDKIPTTNLHNERLLTFAKPDKPTYRGFDGGEQD